MPSEREAGNDVDTPTYLANHEAVVDFYGYWPSFHDAKVCSYRPPQSEDQSLAVTLHTWEMTNAVDDQGYFVLRRHALISFVFAGVHDMHIDCFAADNILFEMTCTKTGDGSAFQVKLDSIMDMSGSFVAQAGSVVAVVPCTADERPL